MARLRGDHDSRSLVELGERGRDAVSAVLESLLKQPGQSPARPIPATFDAFMEAYLEAPRRAVRAFSDAIGPSQGKDRGGPTTLLRSVLKLDHAKVTGAYALDMKFAPSVLAGTPGSAALDRHLQEEIIARATHEV